jgi:hypothetical protein
MIRSALLIMTALSLAWPRLAPAAPHSYFYPFVNPYEATVMELPSYLEVKLPDRVPSREFTVHPFPGRQIPEVFWYEDGLNCTLAYQDHKAPLIFVIAGTGSSHDSSRMVKLQKLFYQAGFHVISLTSPTHMDFIVNASSGLPGDSLGDARDLYRVMELAYGQVRGEIEVSGFALTGYSLGAFNAAFVANLDEQRKVFNFQRVLLLNPAVSLVESVTALDQLLVENVPGSMNQFEVWFKNALLQMAAVSRQMGPVELSGDFLYGAYKRLPPKVENVAALIGLSFRMNSANLVFTADVMNGGGYVVPRPPRLTASSPLTRYAMVSYNTRFIDYFDELLAPTLQKKEPGLTREALLERMSLRHLERYLKSATKIGLVHNDDDIILAPGDIGYLQGVFGNRARIFPTGGHLGNLLHPDVARFMVDFLREKEN